MHIQCRYEHQIEAALNKKAERSTKQDGGRTEDTRAHSELQRAQTMTELLMVTFHLIFSMITPLLVPVVISYYAQPDPLPLAGLTFCAITICMKLVSYGMCNSDFRCAIILS
jgi:hypothetical protein